MSKIYSQIVIAVLFAIIFSISVFTPFAQADDTSGLKAQKLADIITDDTNYSKAGASPDIEVIDNTSESKYRKQAGIIADDGTNVKTGTAADSKVAKKAKTGKSSKKSKLPRKSGTEILSEVMDVISSFGGDAVATAIEEFTANLEQTASLLQSLASSETVDSVNFLIRNALSSLGEGARNVASENTSTDTMQSSDFGEFLESFKSTLLKRCRGKANFSGHILPQLELALPHLLEGLTEMYKNVVDSTGFGLTFGMLTQGTSLLTLLERPTYVSKETFSQFVNFPDEIKHQFETVLEELVYNYIDPTQFDMMLNMAKMYATSFASRRGEHEEL